MTAANPSALQALYRQASALHQAGRLAEAERLYMRILDADRSAFAPRHMLGVLQAQQGRLEDALENIGAALGQKPDAADALIHYGNVLHVLGRHAEALAAYDRALALLPDSGEGWSNRGNSLSELGRHEEALASYDRALAIHPGHADALYNRGNVLRALLRHEEALASYDMALAARPRHVLTLNNRAIALETLGRREDALASYERALRIEPRYAEALNNRGNILAGLDRAEEALASYDAAQAIRPDVQTLCNRANALQKLGRLDQALASYEAALAIRPDAEALFQRGSVLQTLDRNDEALASYDAALALQPDHALARSNRGYLTWTHRRQYDAALADLEGALAQDPALPYLSGGIAHLKMQGADWAGFEQDRAVIEAGVRAGRRVARPFMFQALSDKPGALQACARIFTADLYPPVPAAPHNPARRGGRAKIRLGYLSGEFREQATAILMAGLYERHDRSRFEVIAVDNGHGDGSAMRARLEKSFDRWIDIAHLTDGEAAGRIRREEIDILVNLNGYFGKPRMGVFARRPAPVQVSYLGFPATLGAGYIDYIVADRIVIPEAERRFYDEKVAYLPGCYQVNDNSGRAIADALTRAEAGLPQEAFVFCNLNQSYKLTPATFAGWMRILRQVENGVLWLLAAPAPFAQNLARMAQAHGVAPRRILFAPQEPPPLHLARLRLADLFLDSLPYNAHTTASDALWAGVPLLTRRGRSFPGRVAASLLMAAGLPELVTETAEDYEALAVRLARDPASLRQLRQRLAQNRTTCALFDTDLTRRHLEAAYTRMWQYWLAGEGPQGFTV